MATVQDSPIDPQLQLADRSPKASSRQNAGAKRKTRASIGSNSAAVTPGHRLHRRSGTVQAVRLGSEEPTRGEEDNLITSDYQAESAKRSRIHSPVHTAPAQPSAYGFSNTNAAPQAESSTSSSNPTQNGADGVAATTDSRPNTTTKPGYPFGLTPFRYPCLTPHHPSPPPGDPDNPKFHKFDPSALSPKPTKKPLPAPVTAHAAPHQTAPANGDTSSSTPNFADLLAENNEAAFHSLTALLAASQSEYIEDNHDFGLPDQT